MNKFDPSGNEYSLIGAIGAAVLGTIIANIAIFSFAIVSGSYHDRVDGGLLSARVGEGFGGRGFSGGAGVDVIWQRSTHSLFYALTAEIGRAPVTIFKKQRVSWGVSLGGIVGMTDPQEMAGAAATATFPAAVIHLLPASIVNYNKAWGAMTQLAKRAKMFDFQTCLSVPEYYSRVRVMPRSRGDRHINSDPVKVCLVLTEQFSVENPFGERV